MKWLEHDEVRPAELPDWAKAAAESLEATPFRARLYPEGIVLTRGRRASAVPWADVLVPIRIDGGARLLLAVARRPPAAPWFSMTGPGVDAIDRAVRTWLDATKHVGYRARTQPRAPLPPDEVLSYVLAHRPLPGAVEIPAAAPSVWGGSLIGASVGAFALGLYGLAFGLPGLLVGGAAGALGGGGLVGGIELVRGRNVGRVLVLTPDAFVAAFSEDRPRAVPWAEVGRFAAGETERGEPAIEVFGPSGELLARSAAMHFGAPLEVMVAVAEAYRKRATPSG
ncbi:MAG: hypothetical protein AB7S26_03665 [Sandaracinaceae bacterium]